MISSKRYIMQTKTERLTEPKVALVYQPISRQSHFRPSSNNPERNETLLHDKILNISAFYNQHYENLAFNLQKTG